ncbi:methyltransferase family protein [Pseudahrensia aquimaris]|uniref:Methyltransferase family protein n=1 Tax=Pseudahrensia aquimaris TaxID=744461 RepID=A0ABW3FGM7_9HYPH
MLHQFLPIGWEPERVTPLMTNGGWLIIAIALGLDVWTFLTLRRHRTTIMPHKAASQLAVDGPFAVSRNPIYLGNVLLCLGIGFVIGSRWFLLMAALLFVLLSELAIKREEAHLEANFPEEWKAYAAKVRRWI